MKVARAPLDASEGEAQAYAQGQFRNPTFPSNITTHVNIFHLSLPPDGYLEEGGMIRVSESDGRREMIVWLRRRVAFDRAVVLYEIGIADDYKLRTSGLMFVDIRSTRVSAEMVARMDGGVASVPDVLWHRILCFGHRRIVFRAFTDMEGLEAIRRAAYRRREQVIREQA